MHVRREGIKIALIKLVGPVVGRALSRHVPADGVGLEGGREGGREGEEERRRIY